MRALIVAALALATAWPAGAAPARRARGTGQIVKVEHARPSGAPALGPRHAPVTIEFFCDLSDRRSISIDELLRQLHERHPERLRVVYRLVGKRPRSNWQAEAGREAFAQGKFDEFMKEFAAGGWPQRNDLAGIAERTGMNRDRLDKAVGEGEDGGRHAEAVLADYHRARRRRLTAIPGLLINGDPKVLSQHNLDELEALYDEAYDHARILLDEGQPLDRLYARLLRDADAAVEPPVGLAPGAVDAALGDKPPAGHGELVQVAIDPASPQARGNRSAPVPIVFYCNFQSRNCKQMHDNLEEIRAMFPDEVRIELRQLFDTEDKRQPHARELAQAALCARAQGGFWSFADEMFASYVRRTVSDTELVAIAEKIDLDGRRFKRCLVKHPHAREVDQAVAAARKAGIVHTPAVVIGGRLTIGTQRTDVLRDLVLVELGPGLLDSLAPSEGRL